MLNSHNRKRPTIKDVARACGVSTQTVSRVLNNRSDVSDSTREKVRTIMEQMGYQPSSLARGMRGRNNTLGVIISGLRYKGVSTTLNGVARASQERGCTLILKETPSFEYEDIQPFLQSLMAQDVLGIICAAPQVGGNWTAIQRALPKLAPPVVFLKGNPLAAPMTISIDNYAGGYIATRHLIEQGYTRIAHISGPLEWWESLERRRGWKQALLEAGLPAPEFALFEGDWSSSSGRDGYEKLMLDYKDMDAVFAANDKMALAVLHQAWRHGVNVPERLGVVGFDDLSESAYFTPPLTTVRQDFSMLGELAVRKLLRLADREPDDEAVAGNTTILEPELIVRESTLRDGCVY